MDGGNASSPKRRKVHPRAEASDSEGFLRDLLSCLDSTRSSLAANVKVDTEASVSIQQIVAAKRLDTLKFAPNWSPDVVSLVTAILFICNTRAIDVGDLERVALLYVSFGHLLHAHNGSLYCYDNGARAPLEGLISPGYVLAITQFFRRVEGLMKLAICGPEPVSQGPIPAPGHHRAAQPQGIESDSESSDDVSMSPEYLPNDPQAVMRMVHACMEGKTEEVFLTHLDYVGSRITPGHHKKYPQCKTAFTIGKEVKESICQGASLSRLLKLFCEWCDTPKTPLDAISYEDACILWGKDTCRQIAKSPQNAVYMQVKHRILSPVGDADRRRLATFFSQTMYGNRCGPTTATASANAATTTTTSTRPWARYAHSYSYSYSCNYH